MTATATIQGVNLGRKGAETKAPRRTSCWATPNRSSSASHDDLVLSHSSQGKPQNFQGCCSKLFRKILGLMACCSLGVRWGLRGDDWLGLWLGIY